MSHITKSIKINAPVSKVFDYVTTPANWTTYVTSLVNVKDLSNETPVKGTTFAWTYRMLGINFKGNGEVTSFAKNRKFAMKMEGSFPITETYSFEKDGDATRLTFDIEYDVPGKALGVIANKLVIEKMNVKESVAVLNKIKDICEASHI